MIRMAIVSRAHSSEQAAERRKNTGRINFYPLLGVLVALLTAFVCYGGLLLLLLDDWSFFLSGAEGDARR